MGCICIATGHTGWWALDMWSVHPEVSAGVSAHWDFKTLVRVKREKEITQFSKLLHVEIQYTFLNLLLYVIELISFLSFYLF